MKSLGGRVGSTVLLTRRSGFDRNGAASAPPSHDREANVVVITSLDTSRSLTGLEEEAWYETLGPMNDSGHGRPASSAWP
jgi:hypothetical protein